MSINPDTFQLALDALSQVLRESPNPKLRAKAAESLGQLGNSLAIPILCSALKQEQTVSVQLQIMDAIVNLAQSNPIQAMSETPKYDFRGANIGNFADTVQSGGKQEATQHIYAANQDFDRLLADFKAFVLEVQQKHENSSAEAEVQEIIDAELLEVRSQTPQRWQNFVNLKRLWNGGKKASLKVGEHFTEENVWGKAAIAFLDGILENPE